MAEKIISLSRDSWMPDTIASACYKCEKAFNSFRRRHHCRYCGLLFCAKCSRVDVQLSNNVKLDRTCEKCLSVLQEPQSKPAELAQYPYFPKDNSIFVDEEVEDAGSEANNDSSIDLKGLFHDEFAFNLDLVDNGDYLAAEELDKYLVNRCKEMLNEDSSDWIEPLAGVVKELVMNLHLGKNDKININKYVKVVSFPVEGRCKFFRGVALKRHLASKKMSGKLHRPSILMLSGSSGYFLGDKKIVSIEKLIQQEENFSKILVDSVKNRIKPDLIVIEKTMPYRLIEEMTSIGVDVIQNVKKKDLMLIARLTDSKILSSINQSLYQNSSYLGSCLEFWQQKIGSKIYSFFQSASESLSCGTILLNPMSSDKKNLKSIIRRLLVQYRSMISEKSLLSMFDVNSFNIDSFHSSQTSFIHLSTVRGKMCSRPRIHQIEYYSKNGKTLGDYLKYTLSNVLQKCTNDCNKKILDHRSYYFKKQAVICVSCSVADEPLKTLQAYRECKICGCKSPGAKLNNMAWRFSFNKFIDNFFVDGQIEHRNCSHDFYKSGVFYFGLSSYVMMVSIDNIVLYTVIKGIPYNNEIIEKLRQNSYQAILVSGKNLIKKIGFFREFFFENCAIVFTEEHSLEDGVALNETRRSIEDSFTALKKTKSAIKKSRPSDHLECEYLKQSFFSEFAKLFVHLQTGFDLIDRFQSKRPADSPQFLDLPPLKAQILSDPDFKFFQSLSGTFKSTSESYAMPIDEEDTLSIIAFALNSAEYEEELKEESDDAEEFSDQIEAQLLGSTEDHFVFKYTNNSPDCENLRKIYGDSISIKVTAYFPKQFHALRSFCLDSHYEYLLSISQAQREELHLGKSKAYFRNSADERFIIKIIGEKQFRMFTNFAPNYFRHVCKNRFHSMPSCLVKILGAYRVKVKNHSTGKTRKEYLLVNENLAYGLNKRSHVYDLKGTVNKRRKVLEGDERTKMDLNFVEFMKGLPVVLTADDKKRLDAEVWNDTLFLAQQNVVDYSMLLILDSEDKVMNYGIIDYMEQYTFERAIESRYKTVVGTELPTIIYPKEYKNRFRQHMIQVYFMSVD